MNIHTVMLAGEILALEQTAGRGQRPKRPCPPSHALRRPPWCSYSYHGIYVHDHLEREWTGAQETSEFSWAF
jgi:hypothetical protein